jgi:mercuric ion binding protein
MHHRFALIAAALALSCANAIAAPRQVTLSVPTMDCATCPITIKTALLKVPGVTKAQVSYARRHALVSFDDAKTDVAALTRATGDAGYPSFAAADPR